MITLIKPLWKEHGMDCSKGTAISHEILPSRVFRRAKLDLIENTPFMLKMDPEE